jgi:hypothetical protein
MLNEKIIEFQLTKNAIFIMLPYKILLFELSTLKYVCTIEDIGLDVRKYSISYHSNPVILAYASWSNKSVVKVNKCI